MSTIKQQIEQEASQLALQLYNINLERTKVEERLKELAVSQSAISALEHEQTEAAKTIKEE